MTGGLPYARSDNNISKFWHPTLRYVYRLLAMTIFGQGEPTQVAQAELGLLRASVVPGPTRPHLFVQKCLEIQKSPTRKVSIGAMITILVWNHGIEFPEDYESLSTSASISYDYATLRSVKFFYYKENQGPYLVRPNRRTLSLPPQPHTMFMGLL